MRLPALVSGIMVFLLAIGQGHAEEFKISQKKKRFTPREVVAKLGDSILFVNDDLYAHNLFTDTPGMVLNIRKQMPGDAYRLKLDKRGNFEIRCVIHPRMKMTLQVK